jgi:DNA-binding SARP family transcriptional activator
VEWITPLAVEEESTPATKAVTQMVSMRQVPVRICHEADEDGPSPRLQLRLIDGFRAVHCNDGAVQLAPLGERLVTFLAIRGPSSRQYVAFRLWPDHLEDQALGCLRTALWRLPRPGGDALVQADVATLRLADGVDVDVRRRYAQATAWAEGGEPPAAFETDGFAADILPGWYDDWAIMERERYRQMRLHVLERLSTWATRSGHVAEAVTAGLRAVEGGPLRESARRCLVRAYLAEGNVDEAVRQVTSYLAELAAADLPRQLSPAMTALLPDSVLRMLAPRAPR